MTNKTIEVERVLADIEDSNIPKCTKAEYVKFVMDANDNLKNTNTEVRKYVMRIRHKLMTARASERRVKRVRELLGKLTKEELKQLIKCYNT